ncbi:MAG: hypothetical protein WCH34_04330 [Bacteroidota bacterium]
MKTQNKNNKPLKIRRKKRHFEKPSMVAIILMSVGSPYVEVVLKIPGKIPEKLLYVKNIHTLMSASTWFPTPDPTMVVFKDHVDDFDDAVGNVKAKVANSESVQTSTWNIVHLDVKTLRNYVQTVCNKNIAKAEEIALAAGMAIKTHTHYNVQDFTVKILPGGKVKLKAKSLDVAYSNDWQCTTDLTDPMGWYIKIIDSSLQATKVEEGFTPGTQVHFRHRYILAGGATEWSQIVSVYIIN